jgi:hypothetical protein
MTIGLVSLALEAGVRLGRRRQLRAGGKSGVSGAMVGAAMALLEFMLSFTFYLQRRRAVPRYQKGPAHRGSECA